MKLLDQFIAGAALAAVVAAPLDAVEPARQPLPADQPQAKPAINSAHVNVITLDNQVIGPATQQYILEAIERAESDGAVCLLLELDTPGGLLDSTRTIVKRMMNARVPIVVHVAPAGSRA